MVVLLKGGLGNQMFQYAFGISVSKARGEALSFTRDIPDSDLKRCYALGVFDVPITFVSEMPAPIFYEWNHTYAFDPGVYDKQWASFDGQWQTEKYFDVPLVRDAFSLRSPENQLSGASQAVAREILGCEERSAFLHVRRTDYVGQEEYHTNLGMDYYSAAMSIIKERVGNAEFFVFSDDPAWCKEAFPGLRVVDHNKPGGRLFGSDVPGKEHEDIWLMGLCSHGVIANSSFSWWGAWLGGTRPGRTCIAPRRWLGPAAAFLDTKDIAPERWMKIG